MVCERRQHEVVFALEVLVEGGLADADVGEDLVEADHAEAVAVEASAGGLDEALAGGRGGRHSS